MRLILIFISSVLPQLIMGQYTYFNTHLPPLGGPDAGSGVSSQLIVKNNQIIHVAVYPNFGNYTFSFNVQNMEGVFTEQVNHLTPTGYLLLNYADAIDSHDNGFLWAGTIFDEVKASIRSFNNEMQQEWEIQVPLFYDDQNQPVYHTNEIIGQFHIANKLSNGDIIAAGPITYYNGNEPMYENFWMVRYDANQQLVWEKQLPLYYENIIPESKNFLRVNDLFELPNGELLVWGCWLHAWQPMVLRFDSTGNLLSHTSWGAPGPQGSMNDWLPWPVQISDEEFVFAYKHATYQNGIGPTFSKPRVGFFNAATMEVNLLEPIDRENKHHWVTDFEKAPDGGFVMLGYGIHPHPTDSNLDTEFSYMLKVDENGEEEWYHEYLPPTLFLNPWVYDLEVTPDGGYAFVGNFLQSEDPDSSGWPIPIAQHTWVVKTDRCGEVEFNGCVYTVDVEESKTQNNHLKVWPNPANALINLEFTVNAHSVELIDLYGKTVLSKPVTGNQYLFELKIGDLAPGIYVVQLLDFNGRRLAQTKVVKQ